MSEPEIALESSNCVSKSKKNDKRDTEDKGDYKSGLKSHSEETNGHEEKENAEKPTKINAFQFMMKSRHKSIGVNSSGREVDLNESADSVLSKQEKKVRKSRLENWALEKGGAKRKREYEETGNIIAHKLEKRGKRFRKMLNIDCQSDDEVITKKKRRCVVIQSDEDSNDGKVMGEEEGKKVKKKRKSRLSLNKVDDGEKVENVATTLTPKSVKSWKCKIKLCMDENKKESEKEDVEKIDSNEKTEDLNDENSEVMNRDDEDKEEEKETSGNFNLDDEENPKVMNEGNKNKEEETSENSDEEEKVMDDDKEKETSENSGEEENLSEEKCEVMDEDNKDKEEETSENIDEVEVVEVDEEDKKERGTQNGEAHVPQDGVDISESDVEIFENPETQNKRVLRSRRQKPKLYVDYVLDEDEECSKKQKKQDSDDEDFSSKLTKKQLKVAPVFLKAAPKPKLDPKVIEARRQFLLSGVPSSLKKEMEKQQSIEDIEFDVFPTVSHVQQKSPDSFFWDLPKVHLNVKNTETEHFDIKSFPKNLMNLNEEKNEEKIPSIKLRNCKKIIKEIKSQNPNYPVYKIFNSLYSKTRSIVTKPVEEPKKPTPRRRGRPKKNALDKSKEIITSPQKIEVRSEETHALWTEKYKPKSSTEIIGNYNAVFALKEWLKNWLSTAKNSKKRKDDSDSEFDITDSDSRDSLRVIGSTVILKGPTGSGKTAAVYAVCTELGLDILEVNASSKRTGKRLLQELQEATQSHQVCKTVNLSFVTEKKETPTAKMCAILIDDIDIVFEQDEGFAPALSQIINTSKRPIILTTTDEPSFSIQKVVNNLQIFYFSPLSSLLTIWLQIVCLIEGFYVNVSSLDELLNYNKGDIRLTLLQLQFYVNSGGQPNKTENKNEVDLSLENDIKMDDDNSNLSDLKFEEVESTENVQIHHNCLETCHTINNYKSFSLPHCNNLGIIWWNMAAILNLPNFSKMRLERFQKSEIEVFEKQKEKEKIKMISDCYDSVAFVDFMGGKNTFYDSVESRWRTKTKDSLGLEENMCSYRDYGFCEELGQFVLSGRIKMFKEKFDERESRLNMAASDASERRWRSKQISSEERLEQALLESDCLARRSLVLDYMPYLRNIARSECERAENSTKRGNRYYSHLKSLGVRASNNTLKVSCDVFKISD